MSIGSNLAVEMGEEDHREKLAEIIANRAAKVVAAGDMGRPQAITEAKESVRRDQEEDHDVTGVLGVMNTPLTPSKQAPAHQVAQIQSELMDAAREAADDL